MKFLRALVFLALASNLIWSQSTAQSASPTAPSLADEVNQLREALAAQQKQISQQQQEIENLRQRVIQPQNVSASGDNATPRVIDAALHTSTANPEAVITVQGAGYGGEEKKSEEKSPLSFRIGNTEFTPGGFLDFENVFRTKNSGSVVTTSFGTIPFDNTANSRLSEFRVTGQYSRLSLKVSGKFGENEILGYAEADFNGNDAGNVFVTSNPHTNRARVYFGDFKRHNFEFLGGQAWGWLTPNRVGLGSMNADLMLPNNEDANIQVGLPYTRAGLFHAWINPNEHFSWGVGVENPQQFVTNAVVFPSGFATTLTGQFDVNGAGSATTTPNLMPDFVTKLAFDTDRKPGARNFHFEITGFSTSAKVSVAPLPVTPNVFNKHTAIGGGGEVSVVAGLTKNFRLVGLGLYSDGGGRYLNATGPNAVVRPNATGTDVSVSMVHSGAGLAGVELQATPKTLFAAYYGADYFKRNSFVDTTSTAAPQPIIGFGGVTSSATVNNAANRIVQEATFDWQQTFWKHPNYGSLVLVSQSSYVVRTPWAAAAVGPKNAHLFMQYLSLRYILP